MKSTCLILIGILTYSQRWISYSEGRRCLPAEQWCCWGGDHQTLESCSSCRVSDCEPDQSVDSGSTWPRSWDSSSWSALLRGSDNTEVHARLARLSPGQYTSPGPDQCTSNIFELNTNIYKPIIIVNHIITKSKQTSTQKHEKLFLLLIRRLPSKLFPKHLETGVRKTIN